MKSDNTLSGWFTAVCKATQAPIDKPNKWHGGKHRAFWSRFIICRDHPHRLLKQTINANTSSATCSLLKSSGTEPIVSPWALKSNPTRLKRLTKGLEN